MGMDSRNVFDVTDIANSSNIVSRLYDSLGNALTSTLVSGDQALDVNLVQSVALTVSATDLDIRDLVYSQDSVQIIDAGGDALAINADGSLNIAIASIALDSEYDEDAAHTSGDKGQFILGVANHTEGALHSADGDYAALQLDSLGRLRTTADISLEDLGPNTDAEYFSQSVGTTAAALTTPLADRQKLWLTNLGNKTVYVAHDASVTAAQGFPLKPGQTMEADWGGSIPVYLIAGSGTQDVRVLQLS